MLGTLGETEPQIRLVGIILVGIATLVWVRLQLVVESLRAVESQSRWASNQRDLLNVCAGILLFAAFLIAALPAPAAVLFAGTVGIVVDVLRHLPATPKVRLAVSACISLGLAVSVAAFAPEVLAATNELAVRLFPAPR